MSIAFIEAVVVEYQERRNVIRIPHVNPLTGERRTR